MRSDCYLISFVSGGRYAEKLGGGGRGESREVSGGLRYWNLINMKLYYGEVGTFLAYENWKCI